MLKAKCWRSVANRWSRTCWEKVTVEARRNVDGQDRRCCRAFLFRIRSIKKPEGVHLDHRIARWGSFAGERTGARAPIESRAFAFILVAYFIQSDFSGNYIF